jgi:predicted RecA/RadA family phage recombinase
MSTNYVGEGDCFTFTAPTGGVTKGLPVLIANTLVIPTETVAQTLPFRGKFTGVWDCAKVGSQAWNEGDIIYWDNSAKVFTKTSTSNFRAGFAVLAVGSGAGETVGRVRLNGIAITAVGGVAP